MVLVSKAQEGDGEVIRRIFYAILRVWLESRLSC